MSAAEKKVELRGSRSIKINNCKHVSEVLERSPYFDIKSKFYTFKGLTLLIKDKVTGFEYSVEINVVESE
jgi:hypothetical protein